MTQEDWAIVVGVRLYPDLGDLEGPENDARMFYDWLTSESGGAVSKEQATLVLSSQYHPPSPASASEAEPTAARVERAFDALLDVAEKNQRAGRGLRAGRRLYVYLAGHGFAPRFDESALLMANATRMRSGYHIPGRAYANWFLKAGYFEEIVLLMDCCRSNLPQVPLHLPPYMDLSAAEGVDRSKVFYGFATKWSQTAREKPGAGGAVQGVFTAALLAGLRGGGCEPGGEITAASLAGYLYNHMKTYLTPEELANPENPREPELFYNTSPEARFVIAKVEPPRFPVRIQVSEGVIGKTIEILDARFQVVAELVGQRDPLSLDLPRAMYLARIKGEERRTTFEVVNQGGVDVAL